MPDFTIKSGDTLPKLTATLVGEDGSAIDLSDAESVEFKMRQAGKTDPIITSAATIVDAMAGIVEYAWEPADTERIGKFEAEFRVNFPGDLTQSFPNYKYITILMVLAIG